MKDCLSIAPRLAASASLGLLGPNERRQLGYNFVALCSLGYRLNSKSQRIECTQCAYSFHKNESYNFDEHGLLGTKGCMSFHYSELKSFVFLKSLKARRKKLIKDFQIRFCSAASGFFFTEEMALKTERYLMPCEEVSSTKMVQMVVCFSDQPKISRNLANHTSACLYGLF